MKKIFFFEKILSAGFPSYFKTPSGHKELKQNGNSSKDGLVWPV